MKRADLEHIIRAAAANADTDEIVVIGSQAILGTISEPPAELCQSIEADVFPKRKPGDSILIDGAIGEESMFHRTFGYYAHGVGSDTAVLPEGAFERLVPVRNENTRGNTGWCLELHDLAVSKLAAGRDKDLSFVSAMLAHKFINAGTVRERIAMVRNKEQASLAEQRLNRVTGSRVA
jgi:hypothetical protein